MAAPAGSSLPGKCIVVVLLGVRLRLYLADFAFAFISYFPTHVLEQAAAANTASLTVQTKPIANA